MNTLVAKTAKRVLGARRAVRYYRSAQIKIIFPMKFNFLWHLTKHNKLDGLNRYEARFYSQNGEDGIIAAIFRKLGATNKFCVEFGIVLSSSYLVRGIECNTAHLVKNKGWSSLWMDALEGVESVKTEWVTAENVNQLFTKYNVPRAFDLLSIDIDYNTYWVWKAIEGFSPRVVIAEYNSSFPPTESVAVPYDPQGAFDGTTNYYGASLLALKKLGAVKGYTLVACDNNGFNAFFVRNDLKHNFVTRSVEEIYRPLRNGDVLTPTKEQFIAV